MQLPLMYVNSRIKQDCLSVNGIARRESQLSHYLDFLVFSRARLPVCQETAQVNVWKLLPEVKCGGIPAGEQFL